MGGALSIAAKYRLLFESAAEVGYVGHTAEMRGDAADGRTLLKCVNATRFAIETTIATMIEDGLRPISASARSRRLERINLRLSPEEKAIPTQACALRGIRDSSDFVRSLALGFL